MDKLEELLKRAQAGDEESVLALVALFRDEMWEASRAANNPDERFHELRSEFILEIRTGRKIISKDTK